MVKTLKANDTLISFSTNDQVQVIKKINWCLFCHNNNRHGKKFSHLSLHLRKSCCWGPARDEKKNVILQILPWKNVQDFEVWHEVKLLINKLNGENKDQN